MNINFNKLFEIFKPFFYLILSAYFISILLFFYLPKHGIFFVDDSSSSLNYKRYSFYTKLENSGKFSDEKNNKSGVQNLSKYDLKGIYSTSENKGWIIIEEKAGTNSSYVLSQNEQIDGYTLFKLYKDYVIFQKDKKEYKLEILEKELSSIDYKSSVKEDIVIKNNGAIINRDYLNSYITNLDKIWNNISISEIKDGDKINGFKIEKITKDSAFSKLGLKDGDIIKSVNNIEMNSHAEAFKIFGEMNNMRFLNIQILRNNVILEMNYEVN